MVWPLLGWGSPTASCAAAPSSAQHHPPLARGVRCFVAPISSERVRSTDGESVDDLLTRQARPTARRYASRFTSPFVDAATLEATADSAVWEAAAGYDADRGPFVPYAMRFVRAAILAEVRQAETLLSRHDYAARARLRQGRRLPAAQADRVARAPRRCAMPESETPASSSSSVSPPARDECATLAAVTGNPRDYLLAVRLTGADGARPSSQAELARWLGVSPETVRRHLHRIAANLVD